MNVIVCQSQLNTTVVKDALYPIIYPCGLEICCPVIPNLSFNPGRGPVDNPECVVQVLFGTQ